MGRAGNRGDLPLPLRMFYGEAHHSIYGGDTPIDNMLDAFYLAMVPWFRVHMLSIENFVRTRDKTSTILGGHENKVDIDWGKMTYGVTLNGAAVARTGATFCPLRNDRIVMYSLADSPLEATLPVGWNPDEIAAAILFADRKEPTPFKIDGKRVAVQMRSRRPVMIYRNKSEA